MEKDWIAIRYGEDAAYDEVFLWIRELRFEVAQALSSSQVETIPAGSLFNRVRRQQMHIGGKMIDKTDLCEKIRELYPDIGACGIDVAAEYDEDQKAWVVHLKRGSYRLKTFLEDNDAEKCMLGEKCVGLSIEIAQLRSNIERMPKDR